MNKFEALIKSRRFWVAISGVIIVACESLMGEGTIDPESIQNMVLLFAAWIVGDSLRVTDCLCKKKIGSDSHPLEQ